MSSVESSTSVRRNSFLSKAMLENDVHNTYELGRAEDGSMKYNVSVKEGQGFEWNQDLFVSKYYQKTSLYEIKQQRQSSSSSNEVQEIIISDSEEDDIFPSDY